jgi:hypothetical protein
MYKHTLYYRNLPAWAKDIAADRDLAQYTHFHPERWFEVRNGKKERVVGEHFSADEHWKLQACSPHYFLCVSCIDTLLLGQTSATIACI